jgi:AmmeMemoRadiSam system protein B
MTTIRKAAVAGSWYPGTATALAAAVERHLDAADRAAEEITGEVIALVAPHAGLVYSGPVAAHAYRLLRGRDFDVALLVGPSHFVGFEGVAVYDGDAFETPFGATPIDREIVRALLPSPIVREHAPAHVREHSLEMQLPFLAHLAPALPIVPLVMGYQDRATARALGDVLASAIAGRRALLVASTDLSHYHDARTASVLDRVVIDCVARFDADALQTALERNPEHACGGGPLVAVMRAAHLAGAHDAAVLRYADSGDVSGDKTAVVGYLAAALGTFSRPDRGRA